MTYAQDFAKGAAKGRKHKAEGVMLAKFSRLRSQAWIDGYCYGYHK